MGKSAPENGGTIPRVTRLGRELGARQVLVEVLVKRVVRGQDALSIVSDEHRLIEDAQMKRALKARANDDGLVAQISLTRSHPSTRIDLDTAPTTITQSVHPAMVT